MSDPARIWRSCPYGSGKPVEYVRADVAKVEANIQAGKYAAGCPICEETEAENKRLRGIVHELRSMECLNRLESENRRLRAALVAIQKATVEGRVCDDVAWFDTITTLYDFCADAIEQSETKDG